jgi:hypothetical protein
VNRVACLSFPPAATLSTSSRWSPYPSRSPPTGFGSVSLHHLVENVMALFEDNLGRYFAGQPLRDLVINAEV